MIEVRNLSVSYGKHVALTNIAISVADGEAVVILGANGAGKSSLLKAIAGLAQPAPGAQVRLGGRPLLGLPAHEVLEAGIALVPEGRGIFVDLTVSENLDLGAYARRARTNAARNRDLVFELFPRLAERRRQIVATMSGGEQQMVAIGRALMSSPQLLMLDEPSLGLAPVMVGELFSALGRIRQTGVSLLMVEQNVRKSLSLADRGYVLEAGRIVGEGDATSLKDNPLVQNAFLGMAEDA
ncbi:MULTISPECIES: ABC transporter ATP-binding protein [Chelativorans]|jgi:branched-chain amino acid transport system ATP-binding protein|uniref:Amino acid/amide ABC transporter ATP-binding protein 2, HAAT family n=1 Tax=Chelativorans sp. (strain BNC1) TaxID=266779 RepID=Q11FE6_CHESB|nr:MULTISPECIES: ABC transporter ATP-binding protein [Chelativorans]